MGLLVKHSIFFLICAGVLGGLGHALSNESVKRSDIAVLGPFDYTSVIWALGIDVVIFGFEPNRFGMFGMTLIVIAGLSVAIPKLNGVRSSEERAFSHPRFATWDTLA